jgi:hypothetical protein
MPHLEEGSGAVPGGHEMCSLGSGEDRGMAEQETWMAPFEYDAVLPAQFFTRTRTLPAGEQRLMAAILEDAVFTYCVPHAARSRGGSRAVREAREWIDSTDRSWLFSFERVCDALGLDVQFIRRGVRAWKQRSMRRLAVMADLRPQLNARDADRAHRNPVLGATRAPALRVVHSAGAS